MGGWIGGTPGRSGTVETAGLLASVGSGKLRIDIGQFSMRLVDYAHGLDSLKQGIYYYSAEDGSGKLSEVMLRAALAYVKQVFRDPKERAAAGVMKTNIPGEYADWKKGSGFGNTTRVTTGASADWLRIKKVAGGAHIGYTDMGKNGKTKVKMPHAMSYPLEWKMVSITDINALHEGGKYKLIYPALSHWISMHAPMWFDSFKKAMWKFYGDRLSAKADRAKERAEADRVLGARFGNTSSTYTNDANDTGADIGVAVEAGITAAQGGASPAEISAAQQKAAWEAQLAADGLGVVADVIDRPSKNIRDYGDIKTWDAKLLIKKHAMDMKRDLLAKGLSKEEVDDRIREMLKGQVIDDFTTD